MKKTLDFVEGPCGSYWIPTETIFGVAWQYDLAHNTDGDVDRNTKFDDDKRDDFDDAAQFGNYNAGYTGTYAGVPASHQYIFAGLGEIAKHRSVDDVMRRTIEIAAGIPPHGDEPNDYWWNTQGMNAARKGQ